MSLNTKLGIICGSLGVATAAVWGGIWWVSTQPPIIVSSGVETVRAAQTAVTEQPTVNDQYERRIDGVLVTNAGEANVWPIGVMIENAAFGGVRPQSGLSAAQVVYEVPVEGGITRFLALFAGDLPDKVGPVRSARQTYLEFNSEYDGLYAHAGGSPQALEAVDGLEIKDLSALENDAEYFFRESTLVAPHNLFTTGTLLAEARAAKGLDVETPTYEPWLFKADEPVLNPDHQPLHIDFGAGGPLYAVDYFYNTATNSYDRQNGGSDHTDANTGKIISPKVVIVQLVPAGELVGTEGRINFDVTGAGVAYIAQDGKVITGQWSKTNRTSRTIFRDEAGNRIAFNRGAIWLSIVPATGSVTLPTAQ